MSLPVAGGMPSADRCLLCSAAARSLASRAASSLSIHTCQMTVRY